MRGIRNLPPFFFRLSKDHPRACGEYRVMAYRLHWRVGSPPRMRGIPLTVLCATCFQGITPAHAGNT